MAIYVQIGSESLAVSSTAVGFASIPSSPETVVYAVISVEDAPIRINSDTTPTAAGTEGSPRIEDGGVFEVWGKPDLTGFLAIREGGVDATLRAVYMGTKT